MADNCFSFPWGVGDRSRIMFRPPGIFVGRGDSGSVTVMANIKHV